MKRILFLILFSSFALACADNGSERWTEAEAADYYAETGWVSGCNFIPSNAINQLEMWQEETFDLNTIDRELGWAEELGFNCMRVFLHHLLWEQDRDGFVKRIGSYLDCADSHGIMTMFVFLDDCWNETASLGVQPVPVRGRHNSGWLKDPGALYYGPAGSGKDYSDDKDAVESLLKSYVQDIMTEFKDDGRIFAWDLYNEPGGGQDPDRYYERSFPLLRKIFAWAREVSPSQPITSGIWSPRLSEMNHWQILNSDIITYHTYEDPESHMHMIDTLRKYNRPMVCTEYMARTQNSTFANTMPMLRANGIGAVNWGFVSGKTNTIFSWDTINAPMDADEPELWFHDILRADGAPYIPEETEIIKAINFGK